MTAAGDQGGDSGRSGVSPLGPRFLLHAEGLAVFVLSVAGYAHDGRGWVWFAILFLAPDITFLAYLAGPKIGAWCYNLAHTYVVPVGVAIALLAAHRPDWIWPCLIWTAHIRFDRLLGYGLKYEAGFKQTHFERI